MLKAGDTKVSDIQAILEHDPLTIMRSESPSGELLDAIFDT
jgi:hypothetical protein